MKIEHTNWGSGDGFVKKKNTYTGCYTKHYNVLI